MENYYIEKKETNESIFYEGENKWTTIFENSKKYSTIEESYEILELLKEYYLSLNDEFFYDVCWSTKDELILLSTNPNTNISNVIASTVRINQSSII